MAATLTFEKEMTRPTSGSWKSWGSCSGTLTLSGALGEICCQILVSMLQHRITLSGSCCCASHAPIRYNCLSVAAFEAPQGTRPHSGAMLLCCCAVQARPLALPLINLGAWCVRSRHPCCNMLAPVVAMVLLSRLRHQSPVIMTHLLHTSHVIAALEKHVAGVCKILCCQINASR